MAGVRSRSNALGRLLDQGTIPLYACDDAQHLIYCNQACADLVGLNCDDLVGKPVHYRGGQGGTDPADVAASLCPPPATWNGQILAGKIDVLHRSGRWVTRHAVYLPLGENSLECAGVLTVLFESDVGGSICASAAEAMELHRQLNVLRFELLSKFHVGELIGDSPAIVRVRRQAQAAAAAQMRTVVYGPRGSGREHVARWIHQEASRQVGQPLLPLFCPMVDAELIQSSIRELLVQVRQSETRRIPNLLLLDVDQLSPEGQAELNGFLSLPDFQLQTIATATRPLEELARQSQFLAELTCRLTTLTIHMPSLAERREDIPLLGQFFVEQYNGEHAHQITGFAPEAMDELVGYAWPGNVEQLSDAVAAACSAAEGPLIQWSDIPDELRWSAASQRHVRREEAAIDLDQLLRDIERELIQRAVRLAKGNKTKAAQLLGLSRARLHRRLDESQPPGAEPSG